MTITLEGFPTDIAADLATSAVVVSADSTVYPLQALYGAAYTFIDRCYVFVDRPDPSKFRVTLSTKKPGADEAMLRALAGEFANELISCAWRHQITQDNRNVIEQVTTQALSGAMGPPSLDELAAFDFTEESFEDPLGIAMSWEDKYKKKDKPADGATAAPAASAETSASVTVPGKGETP